MQISIILKYLFIIQKLKLWIQLGTYVHLKVNTHCTAPKRLDSGIKSVKATIFECPLITSSTSQSQWRLDTSEDGRYLCLCCQGVRRMGVASYQSTKCVIQRFRIVWWKTCTGSDYFRWKCGRTIVASESMLTSHFRLSLTSSLCCKTL